MLMSLRLCRAVCRGVHVAMSAESSRRTLTVMVETAKRADMALKGKKVAILAGNNFEDAEFIYPRLRFMEEGCTVLSVGTKEGLEFKGKHGYPTKSTIGIDDVKASDIDALIIPGGFAPDYWRRDAKFLTLVQDMDKLRKPVAAVCHGPWVLISAKVVRGRHLTSFVAIKDDVENAGAIYEDKEVVVDGHIVTSRLPDDLPAFCRAVIGLLSAK